MGSAVRFAQHIFRFACTLLIAFQLGQNPMGNSTDAAGLICNPSGQAPSAEAVKSLEILFAAAGKSLPKERATSEHCSKCIGPAVALITPRHIGVVTTAYQMETAYTVLSIGYHYDPQGPPLGGRAPPYFV